MWYWTVLLVLAILVIFSIIFTIGGMFRERKDYRGFLRQNRDGLAADGGHLRKPVKKASANKQEKRVERNRNVEKRETPRRESAKEETKKLRWKIILTDPDTLEDYEYIFYDSIGIGRTKNLTDYEEFLMVNDSRVSKVHCAIVSRNDKLFLRDEGSRNHTFLNGKKLQRPAVIQKDDVIIIGGTRLEIVKIFRETA